MIIGVINIIFSPLSQWPKTAINDSRYGKQIEYMNYIYDDLNVLNNELNNQKDISLFNIKNLVKSDIMSQEMSLKKDGKESRKLEKILVIIDDLDRCEPKKAVEVLHAINLLLNFDSFIVILGLDARIITKAIDKSYDNLLSQAGASGYEYLDKIIQIPFLIPEPNYETLNRFIAKQMGEPKSIPQLYKTIQGESALFEMPRQSSIQEPIIIPGHNETKEPVEIGKTTKIRKLYKENKADKYKTSSMDAFTHLECKAFQDLSYFLKPNPRHLKRMINIYRLVRHLAKKNNNYIILKDPYVLIKWLIMCSNWPYKMNALIYLYKVLHKLNIEGKLNHLPLKKGELLIYLLREVEKNPRFNIKNNFDSEPNDLIELIGLDLGEIGWIELESLLKYTINFNPSVEVEFLSDFSSMSHLA